MRKALHRRYGRWLGSTAALSAFDYLIRLPAELEQAA